MPSTLVHVGFGALIAAALLGPYFDIRTVSIVLASSALPDLDTFIGLWVMEGAHRTLLHNVTIPAVVLLVVVWDLYYRETSFVRDRWGAAGGRTVLVSVIGGWLVAQVLLDAFFNGTNLFWPFYDQFVDLSGEFYYSTQHGFVQTFIDLQPTADGTSVQISPDDLRGSRTEYHYYTGVDPGPDFPADVERRFPIADEGPLFLVMLTGFAAAALRLVETHWEALTSR